MGYREHELKLPLEYTETEIRTLIAKSLQLPTEAFSFRILRKSLDARKKSDLHWTMRVGVTSERIREPARVPDPPLVIPFSRSRGSVVVTGSGPAGFFAAFVLQKAGFDVTLIERGVEVDARSSRIARFEETGVFDPLGNYAFGEGGAGTFSDGKLTSRTKRIPQEKAFILSSYIAAGAPEEIGYLTHPHIGSDNLRTIVRTLTRRFREIGGQTLFQTTLNDLRVRDGVVRSAITSRGDLEAEHFIVAPGHSAYDTYRLLIRRGVRFRTKGFALGSRVEHPQTLINEAQWGVPALSGVGAAEYRLSSAGDGSLPVYSFCMCPGGVVVPAAPASDLNVVNGMSLYARDGFFANAGCVAGIDARIFLGADATALQTLDWLESIERAFADFAPGYQAPACGIADFVARREPVAVAASSYPLGLLPAPLWELLPPSVSAAMSEGLRDFARRIRGFEIGSIMGLESKSSSPIQVVRGDGHRCEGLANLSVIGEGSGYSGGIISSAVDGIQCAMELVR